jgi:acetyltransferase-like isoleucine patch superfamily enzyme
MMANNPLAKIFIRFRLLRRAYLQLMRQAYQDELLRERFPTVTFGRGVIVRHADKFFPGKGVFIHDLAYLNCSGDEWNGFKGFLRIGDNSEIAPFVAIWGAGEVTIGKNVHVGDCTTITAHSSRAIDARSDDVWKKLDFDFGAIVIEDHVIVGSHVTILPGVHIGRHAMVGAGSVVTANVAAYTIVAGSPAHVLRELPHEEAQSVRST